MMILYCASHLVIIRSWSHFEEITLETMVLEMVEIGLDALRNRQCHGQAIGWFE